MHCAAIVYCSNSHYVLLRMFGKSNFSVPSVPFHFLSEVYTFFLSSADKNLNLFCQHKVPHVNFSLHSTFFIWIIYFIWIPFHFVRFSLLSGWFHFVDVHHINGHLSHSWIQRLFFWLLVQNYYVSLLCSDSIGSSPVITDNISNFLEGDICPLLWQCCIKWLGDCKLCSAFSICLKFMFENSENPALSFSYLS